MLYMRALAAIGAVLILASATEPPATQHDGLTVEVRTDSPTVEMGAPVVFHVSLGFDTSKANAATRILNRYLGRCEFTFLSNETGLAYQCRPYDTGMPGSEWPGNLHRLKHGERLPLAELTVHLLAATGEQIPPGKYAVTVVYANDGGENMDVYLDSAQQYQRRRYDGPWRVWSGRVTSQPLALTILDVPARATVIAIPKTLEISTTKIKGQVGWRPAEGDSTISVVARPGFALGNRWELHTIVDGDTIWRFPQGLGSPDWSAWSFLPPDVFARIESAKRAELVLHMEVFESSVQPQHMWMPEQGVFQVLWKGQARYLLRPR